MESKNNQIIELLKYPILVFSVVAALIILKFSLNIEFGLLTELSTDGLKFSEKSNKATLEAITELESKLNDLSVRLESLENNETGTPETSSEAQLKAFSASQYVSDATANIARLGAQISDGNQLKLTGWMWIGNYDSVWDKAAIARLDTGQPVELEPQRMQPGSQYKVLGNLVVRDGLPPNNVDYYRARKSLGVVSRGSVVTILSAPVGIDREFAVQYWVEIEYQK